VPRLCREDLLRENKVLRAALESRLITPKTSGPPGAAPAPLRKPGAADGVRRGEGAAVRQLPTWCIDDEQDTSSQVGVDRQPFR